MQEAGERMGDGCDIEPRAGVGVVEKNGVGFGGAEVGGGRGLLG